MTKLVRSIRLNDLDYHPNRSPRTYSRPAGATFRIHAFLEGGGSARVELLDAQGNVLHAAPVILPGEYRHELSFGSAGARRVTLKASATNKHFSQDLHLDVAHPD